MQTEKTKTEKALRSQIGQDEKTKKKAIDDLKTTEKKAELTERKLECKLLVFLVFISYCVFSPGRLTPIWLSFATEQAESSRLRADIEVMKDTLRTSENRLLEVTQIADQLNDEIFEAQQMRESANRDLLQALTMTEKLAGLTDEHKELWDVVKPLAERCSTPEDVGKEWPQILPLLPQRFDAYVCNVVKECVQSLLAQLRVTESTVNIEKLADPIPPGPVADAIGAELDGVEVTALRITSQMCLPGGPDYGVLVRRDQLDQVAHDEELQLGGSAIGIPKEGSIYDSQLVQEEMGAKVESPSKDAVLPEDLGVNPKDAPATSQDPLATAQDPPATAQDPPAA